jgi:hypothetical protein
VNRRQTLTLEPGSNVWAWDSMWLPAVVVGYGVDAVRVRLAHGVTFNVSVDKLVHRDPSRAGRDTPGFSLAGYGSHRPLKVLR